MLSVNSIQGYIRLGPPGGNVIHYNIIRYACGIQLVCLAVAMIRIRVRPVYRRSRARSESTRVPVQTASEWTRGELHYLIN